MTLNEHSPVSCRRHQRCPPPAEQPTIRVNRDMRTNVGSGSRFTGVDSRGWPEPRQVLAERGRSAFRRE